MTRWVALLRGVNVGGITVRSPDLQALFAQLGLSQVRTVLASGNIVFDAAPQEPLGALKTRIEAGLRERFGYDAWVVLLEADGLAAVCAGYPFERHDPARHPYVVFSSDDGVLAELAARAAGLADEQVEQVRRVGSVLYWDLPRGSSTQTPFARAGAAARYKPYITTRNLRTLEKVVATAAR